ncbi:MAG: DUF2267 domain-containing protein [Anaerolineae bacterium]
MDELSKMIAQKLGISEAQANQAVQMVVAFLKSKLPEGIGGQLDAVLSGKGAGDVLGGIGNLLGKK